MSSTFVISETEQIEGVRRANFYYATARALALPAEMDASHVDALRLAVQAFDEDAIKGEGTVLATIWEEALLDREALAVAYARLFLGPFEVLVPPYASMYLEPDKKLMGEVSCRVADTYREAGLNWSEGLREIPDHIALEMEFMYYLGHRWLDEEEAEWKERQTAFWLEHLRSWLRDFSQAMLMADVHPFYTGLGRLLLAWVDREESSHATRRDGSDA